MKYDEIVAYKIKDLKEKIAKAKLLNVDVKLVKEIMPDAGIWLDHEVNVDWAVKGMDDVKVVLREFAKNGVMLDRFESSDTSPIWYLQGKNAKIRLLPRWPYNREEGVSCALVKVGEETFQRPIYKLMCDGKEVVNES